jgi:hypothetical protein
MANRSLTMILTGPAELVDAGVDAVARTYGWKDGPDETRTKEDVVREAIRRFLRETVTAFNMQAAREQAAAAAQEQTTGALDALEMTLQ